MLVNKALQWRHNGYDGISNHQPYDCLLNRLFRRRSKKTSKLHVTGLCEGNSPVTGEFPAQRGSNAENVSIWWRHHDFLVLHEPMPTYSICRHGKQIIANAIQTNQILITRYSYENVLFIIMFIFFRPHCVKWHYNDVIMGPMASQITSLTLFTQRFFRRR